MGIVMLRVHLKDRRGGKALHPSRRDKTCWLFTSRHLVCVRYRTREKWSKNKYVLVVLVMVHYCTLGKTPALHGATSSSKELQVA